MLQRCGWVTQDPLYLDYHDNEWGKPCFDEQQLFAMLCLEGQQAGLSWYTILKKRAGFYQCFHHFVPEKVAAMTEEDVERLLLDPAIIRNRLKINAIINNARACLAMRQQGENFVDFIWSFVDGVPQINYWGTLQQVPAKTAASDSMSKALKQRGFKFVGSTICYAFMQACGLVDDHLLDCFCRKESRG